MSSLLLAKNTPPRFNGAAASIFIFCRTLFAGAGLVFFVALAQIYLGNERLLNGLQEMLPEAVSPAGAAEAAPEESNAASALQPVSLSSVEDALTPRMRAALAFMSRRYRVSSDVLEPIFATAETSARALHIDPLLIVSVIAIESRFNPFSESVVGAQGLMQVMPRWHQDKLPEDANELSFFDPVLNVQIGARILKESITRNGGLIPGLQQFAGASTDPEQRYAGKVLAEKARIEAATRSFASDV